MEKSGGWHAVTLVKENYTGITPNLKGRIDVARICSVRRSPIPVANGYCGVWKISPICYMVSAYLVCESENIGIYQSFILAIRGGGILRFGIYKSSCGAWLLALFLKNHYEKGVCAVW